MNRTARWTAYWQVMAMSSENEPGEAFSCDRCGDEDVPLHPLDTPLESGDDNVCDDCLKPWDEVVQV